MTDSGASALIMLAERVVTQLHQRRRPVPLWAVRELLEARLTNTVLSDLASLPDAAQRQLVTTTVELIVRQANQRGNGSPAALDLPSAGRVITALALVSHNATLNLHSDKWAALAALTNSAQALVGIGAAMGDADRIAATTVLLSPDITTAAHDAIDGALVHLHTGAWATIGKDHGSMQLIEVLQSTLRILPSVVQ